MKIWKLVSGIISIALCGFVIFQSCSAGVSNSLMENGEVSGTSGLIVAIFMLAGGILSIVTRNSEGKGGNIAMAIVFGIAAVIGLTTFGSFSDLAIWSVWCLVNGVLAVISIFINRKKSAASESNSKEQ